MGTPWGEIIPDGIGAFGVAVAGVATWFSQQASRRSLDVSEQAAAIEQDRRRAERVPVLSARLECWGPGSNNSFGLSVWLESSEPLAKIRVVTREARNMDCPVGFAVGQNGVKTELPRALDAEGILPAWTSDTVRPAADWLDRMAPGTAAYWLMELRDHAKISAGSAGVRFKALAWAERDDQQWELPLPVAITDAARSRLDGAAASSGR